MAHQNTNPKPSQASVQIEGSSIAAEVHGALPDLLHTTVDSFNHPHEQDVYLVSSLPVLAGCMPNVVGTYKGARRYSPTHYVCLIARAASGKSTIKWARHLGRGVHANIQSAGLSFGASDEPSYTQYRGLFLPANTSAAALMQALRANDGRGIMVEDEIDTLNTALDQDWGSFSQMLRKAAEHEPLSALRVSADIYVERPELSVVLAGTPQQASGLFQSIENGLYSRFSIYAYSAPREWLSGPPTAKDHNRHSLFDDASATLQAMFDQLRGREPNLEFELTDDQWNRLDSCFHPIFTHVVNSGLDSSLDSCVYRAGVTAFRIAMVLTVLRAHQNGDDLREVGQLQPTMDDLDAGLMIASRYCKNAIAYAQGRPPGANMLDMAKGEAPKTLYAMLPPVFERKEAVEIGEDIDIAESTVDRYLREMVQDGRLTKPKQGHYQKPGS